MTRILILDNNYNTQDNHALYYAFRDFNEFIDAFEVDLGNEQNRSTC